MDSDGWVRQAKTGLERANVDLVAYLPDSKTAPLVEAVEADPAIETLLVTREESAVGVLVGGWVGGMRGALVCQSSGLANAVNALGSLSVPARAPFVGVVTRRGNLGEFNVAQVPAGYAMDRILDDLGVRNTVVTDADGLAERVRMAAESAFSTQSPYVVLVDGAVTGGKPEVSQA